MAWHAKVVSGRRPGSAVKDLLGAHRPDELCDPTVLIAPLGGGLESYHVEFSSTAPAPGWLSTTVWREIMADCDGWLDCPADLNADGLVSGIDRGNGISLWGLCAP